VNHDRPLAECLAVHRGGGQVSLHDFGPARQRVGKVEGPTGEKMDLAERLRLDVVQDVSAHESGGPGDEEVRFQGTVFRSSSAAVAVTSAAEVE